MPESWPERSALADYTSRKKAASKDKRIHGISSSHSDESPKESEYVNRRFKPGPQLVVAVVGVVGRSCGTIGYHVHREKSGVVSCCELL